MTIEELIIELSRYPKTHDVLLAGGYGDIAEVIIRDTRPAGGAVVIEGTTRGSSLAKDHIESAINDLQWALREIG
jgi:predicted GTPase